VNRRSAKQPISGCEVIDIVETTFLILTDTHWHQVGVSPVSVVPNTPTSILLADAINSIFHCWM
jgi:hypothetical protein